MKDCHLSKVQYEMKAIRNSVNLEECNIWSVRRKSARKYSETWKKCNMMMMNCFWVTVDRRKAISLISGQHSCQRFSPFAYLQYPASRIWTFVEPRSRSCWMTLYITNDHFAGVPQIRKLQRNAMWKECNIKIVQLEKSII